MDVERRTGLDHGVGLVQRLHERLDAEERTVRGGVHVREVDHGAYPIEP